MISKPAITKKDAAVCQLDTAIKMFFENSDPISIHTLAGAASIVFEDLCKKKRLPIFFDFVPDTFHQNTVEELHISFRKSRNFFKHAKDDSKEELTTFDDEDNELLLYACAYDCATAFRGLPISAQVFQGWYHCCFPEKFNADITEPFKTIFPAIRTQKLETQKKMGLNALKTYDGHASLLSDQRTIPVPRYNRVRTA